MGFVRPSGRDRRQSALIGALVAACLLAAGPAGAALDDEARAEINHQRGAHALRAGNPEEAVVWLDKALALQPDRVESLALKARALLEQGKAQEAEAVTRHLKAIRPGDSDVTFLLAMTAYRQNDWISAKQYLEEARAQHPGDARVRLYLGRTYQELGQDTDAERELLEAARLDPEFRAPAAYRMAILHLQRAETKQAKRRFEEVKDLVPGTELASSAELYLKLMSASQPRRYSAWFKVGGAYDTNMSLASAGGDLVGASGESGFRGSLEVGTSVRLFTYENVTMRAGFTNYLSRHNKLHEFDIEQLRPWVLTTWQPLEWLALDARLTYELVHRDFGHFKKAIYGSPAIRFLPAPGWVTRAFAEWEVRDYYDAFEAIRERDRDGTVVTFGIDQYIPLPNPLAEGPAYLRFGYRHRSERSNGPHFRSVGNKPLATLGVALPWNFNVTIDASWERRDFAHPSVFEYVREILAPIGDDNGDGSVDFGDLPAYSAQPVGCRFSARVEDYSACNSRDRLDKVTQVRLRMRKNIGRHWILETYYRWTDWESNTQEFNFNRHIVGLAATFRL